MPSTAGRICVAIGTILFLHSAYSVYEDRSLGSDSNFRLIPTDIIIQIFVSVFLLMTGVIVSAPQLKPISWETEMRRRTIDEVDSRMNFAAFNHRGKKLFAQ